MIMSTLITAAEARDRIIKADTASATAQMKKIIDAIQGAIDKNEFSVTLYETYIVEANGEKLAKLGYNVNSGSARNESWTTISW